MRRTLIIALIVIVFAIMVVGAKDISKKSEVQYTDHTDSIVTVVIDKITGATTAKNNIDVVIDGSTVATIPEDSKFAKIIAVHEDCLKYQYGTDLWYSCEEAS